MDADAILHEFAFARELPREALAAAAEQRETMVPIFLQEIESYRAKPPEDRDGLSPLFFIFHLLGEWREKSAYRPLARLLRNLDDDVGEVLGEGKTETSHRVMAAVYDGDPQPLMEIVLDPSANEYVRASMFEALALLVRFGQADRAEVTQFVADCFIKLQQEEPCLVWHGWQSAIVILELRALVPQVKEALDREFIPSWFTTFEEFEEDLDGGPHSPLAALQRGDKEFSPFGSVVDELSEYVRVEPDEDLLPFAEDPHWDDPWQEPAVNPYKNVGRNDPCPCGSGKKFKKCCLP